MPLRLALALTLLGLLACPALAAADEAEPLFDPAAVAEIDFTLPPASLQKLEEEPETDKYQHAAIAVKAGGQTYELADVGFRLKGGHGSFRELTGKAAFKVKFKEFGGPKFLGLKKLTLNNMVQDPSMVHETMAYELFRALDVPASRTGYAFVRVNGKPYGVYLDVETLDDVMLPAWFASTQHLYEADDPGVDVRTGEAETFEVDEGDEEDFSDLEALIEAVNDEAGDWSDNVSPVADLEEMTRAWAVERYVAHWDGYAGRAADFRPNNYYLHSDEAGVFQTLPWGTDQTWELDKEVEFDETAGGLMFNECLADASCEAEYKAGLEAVAATIPDLDLDRVAVCTAEMLAPWQQLEDPGRAEYDAEEIAAGVADARAFIADRPGELAGYLGSAGPAQPAPVDSCPAEEPGNEESGDKQPLITNQVQMPPPTEGIAVKVAALKRVARKGKRLRVGVFTPAPGSLKLVAKTAERRGSLVCRKRTTVSAGMATLSCRLSRAAIKALKDGSLRLVISVRVPGDPEPLTRQVRLPRL